MKPMQVATDFFHACEGLQGWPGCQQYVADKAVFEAQCEPLADINTIEDYCNWMSGLGSGPLSGCRYELHVSAFDEESSTALFFATFSGSHVADGGPIPPTNQETNSHYVYAITLNEDKQIVRMTKVWNAPWALAELGWA
jgi:hypothetical protein